MLAPLCVSARHSVCWHLMGNKDTEILFKEKRHARMKSTPIHPLVTHWKPSVDDMFLRFKISSSLPRWCFLHFTFPLNVCTCSTHSVSLSHSWVLLTAINAYTKLDILLAFLVKHRASQTNRPPLPFLSHHRSTQKHISAHEHVYTCVCVCSWCLPQHL